MSFCQRDLQVGGTQIASVRFWIFLFKGFIYFSRKGMIINANQFIGKAS